MSWAYDEIIAPLHEPQPYERAFRSASVRYTASRPVSPPTPKQPDKKSPDVTVENVSDLTTQESPQASPNQEPREKKRRLSKLVDRLRKIPRSIAKMSERPLQAIKRATKAADRAPHLRKQNRTGADIVDVLDETGIGGPYHHDGPYDATLASRNRDKRYAPVEAVKYGNSEALKATPRENVVDSLERHVPLQGTANIPPGERDLSGRVMEYEEGTDLMREADAPGGAYKRWDHIKYHPDDLKGKGEPAYTIEEAKKKQKAQGQGQAVNEHGDYEMQETAHATGSKKDSNNVTVRERSASLGAAGPSSSKGKRLSDGIKRRIGSIRRKHDDI